MIIAIDGPAGAGKSTVATRLARELGFQLVNTGAMFRAVAFEAERRGVALDDGPAVAEVARSLSFAFEWEGDENVVYCNGARLDAEIRSAEVSRNASIISAHPDVRQVLLEQQREVGRRRPSVLEGRDIGTVIFPDAPLKVFITASPQERARRRVEQMHAQGQNEGANYDEVLSEIIERDRRDSERAVAPLKKADDAIEIDTTDCAIDDVLERLRREVRRLEG